MYKHNKEILFLERTELVTLPFFNDYLHDPVGNGLPEGVTAIKQVDSSKIPTKYMLQLGGVHAATGKVIYMVEFKNKKARDTRF